MNADTLIRQRLADWQRLEALLKGRGRLKPAEAGQLALDYRNLARDLVTCRQRQLGDQLERYLDDLASRAHTRLYQGQSTSEQLKLWVLLAEFPPALRRNARFFWIATAIFMLPALLAVWAASWSPDLAVQLLGDEGQLRELQAMYAEAPNHRSGSANALMTGFYIQNNIGIAYAAFSTGILFGVAPFVVLLKNGLVIGASLGHLLRVGLGAHFLEFVAAHSSWELLAIIIAGAAGMQMGFALVVTQGQTRIAHLLSLRLELLRQLIGLTLMLVVAALTEGWVSPSALPAWSKGLYGALSLIFIIAWLGFSGRKRPLPPDLADSPWATSKSPGARA